MTTKNKLNKSEIVRQILKEIGADKPEAPEGWKKRVEEELAKHMDEHGKPASLHPVQIYNIRREMVSTKKPKTEKKLPKKTVKTHESMTTQWEQFCSFGKFVEEFGGVAKVETMLNLYKQLPQNC